MVESEGRHLMVVERCRRAALCVRGARMWVVRLAAAAAHHEHHDAALVWLGPPRVPERQRLARLAPSPNRRRTLAPRVGELVHHSARTEVLSCPPLDEPERLQRRHLLEGRAPELGAARRCVEVLLDRSECLLADFASDLEQPLLGAEVRGAPALGLLREFQKCDQHRGGRTAVGASLGWRVAHVGCVYRGHPLFGLRARVVHCLAHSVSRRQRRRRSREPGEHLARKQPLLLPVLRRARTLRPLPDATDVRVSPVGVVRHWSRAGSCRQRGARLGVVQGRGLSLGQE